MITRKVSSWVLSISIASSFAVPGHSLAATAPKLDDVGVTRCSDWSVAKSFESASAEYMALSAEVPQDFGCMTRASWTAIEDLFKSENSGLYIERLKQFDAKFRQPSLFNPQTAAAFDDFKVLLQLRWLNESYSSLKDYHSTAVTKGVTGTVTATAAVAGAALLLKNPALMRIGKTARPALIRMVKYLGIVILAKTVSTARKDGSSSKAAVAFAETPPPMDLLGGSNIYWNYSDLHLMRDIASTLADSTVLGMAEATVAILALRYFGAAATAGGFFSASSLVGMAIGYPLSKLAAHYTEKAITDQYHRNFSAETAAFTERIQNRALSDWERYSLGALLTKSTVSWVSTQDLYLQNHIEENVQIFSKWQVCMRLKNHTLKQFIDERLASDPKAIAQTSQLTEDEAARRFEKSFDDSEKSLRKKIQKAIDSRRERLLVVRASLVNVLGTLQNIDKPYLRDYVVQQQALIDRLDRYLNKSPIIDDEIAMLKAHAASLAPSSAKWKDASFIQQIGNQYACE